MFSRAQFNSRVQKQGESPEAFVAGCSALVDKCNYGSLRSELLRDRLIVGTNDKKLSRELQMKENLTLEKTIDHLIQTARANKQNHVLHPEKGISYVEGGKPKGKKPKPKGKSSSNSNQRPGSGNSNSTSQCDKCGKSHKKDQCPARDKTCYRCRGRHHFPVKPNFPHCEKVTNDKTVGFLGAIEGSNPYPWTVDILVNGVKVCFVVDSGACLTAMPTSLYDRNLVTFLKSQTRLRVPTESL